MSNLINESNNLRTTLDQHVATVEVTRGPNNFFDFELIREIANQYDALSALADCRVIILCSSGKHFCAGADFNAPDSWGENALTDQARQLYVEAVRLFRCKIPVIAAIQGAAVGGGLGLALSTDFRVSTDAGRFTANFARLGFHQGFGLSVTLPRLIGQQKAAWLLYSGERMTAARALEIGLIDKLVPVNELRKQTMEMAIEIANSGPLAVREIHATLRHALADDIARVTDRELNVQSRLLDTEDFKEGIAAMAARRLPQFHSR